MGDLFCQNFNFKSNRSVFFFRVAEVKIFGLKPPPLWAKRLWSIGIKNHTFLDTVPKNLRGDTVSALQSKKFPPKKNNFFRLFQKILKSKNFMFFVIPDLFPYILATFDFRFEVKIFFTFFLSKKVSRHKSWFSDMSNFSLFCQIFSSFISFVTCIFSNHFVIKFWNFRLIHFLSHVDKNVTLILFPSKIYFFDFFSTFPKSKNFVFFVISDLFPYVLDTFDFCFEVWKIFGFLWRGKRLSDFSHFLKNAHFLTQIVVFFFLEIFDQNFEIIFHLSHAFSLIILW